MHIFFEYSKGVKFILDGKSLSTLEQFGGYSCCDVFIVSSVLYFKQRIREDGRYYDNLVSIRLFTVLDCLKTSTPLPSVRTLGKAVILFFIQPNKNRLTTDKTGNIYLNNKSIPAKKLKLPEDAEAPLTKQGVYSAISAHRDFMVLAKATSSYSQLLLVDERKGFCDSHTVKKNWSKQN